MFSNPDYIAYINQYCKSHSLNKSEITAINNYYQKNICIRGLPTVDSKFSLWLICNYYGKNKPNRYKGIYKQELLWQIGHSSSQLNILYLYHQLANLKPRFTKTKLIKQIKLNYLKIEETLDSIPKLGLLSAKGNYFMFSSKCARIILRRLQSQDLYAFKLNQSYLSIANHT